jgi:Glutathione S-transferase, N-terminal domain
MITLYDFGNSVCCQKVRITLCEKGLEWEAVKVDLFRAQQYEPQYLKLNPKGVVPTLVHDDRPVIESTLICEYLDDAFPEPSLVPADPWLRSRMRIWSKLVDEGLFEGITEISFSAMFRERMRNMPDDLREIRFRNIGDPRGAIASNRRTSSACNRRSCCMPSPPTNEPSGCWSRRWPKGAPGSSEPDRRSPTSTSCRSQPASTISGCSICGRMIGRA